MDFEIIIIDDSQKLKTDTVIWDLMDKYGKDKIIFIEKSQDGLNYVFQNLDKNLIVLLDIQFPANEKKGDAVFNEIIEKTKLIPIIFFSGNDLDNDLLKSLLNNHAFGYVSKMKNSDEIIHLIDEALLYLQGNIENAIEDWILSNEEDKDKPIYISSDGQSLSLNDILSEVRQQTEIGKDFSRKLNTLTIDLLMRKKENLDG